MPELTRQERAFRAVERLCIGDTAIVEGCAVERISNKRYRVSPKNVRKLCTIGARSHELTTLRDLVDLVVDFVLRDGLDVEAAI